MPEARFLGSGGPFSFYDLDKTEPRKERDMRQNSRSLFLAVALLLLTAPAAQGTKPITAADAPKADARLLRKLQEGADRLRVVIRLKDGTPSARALLATPDPEGEEERGRRRLAAQRHLIEEMPREFEPIHTYESFSLLSGTATREGVIALANRSDVLSVTVDGIRKLYQAPIQPPLALVRSREANALGFTGKGQTVAVLDSGVDYTIPGLGGGGFPNAKVIGGIDTANKDADPMDCDGHGTSVASIIASPEGIAPDARIVAVKVFGDCEPGAFLSDIFAGINFAIVNRNRFNISAINMSLGGPVGVAGEDLGYCDALDPESAAAVDAAAAAGIAVFISSGNEAQSNALSTPACLSSAISVGAVYSERQVGFNWFNFCSDKPLTPDAVVCFSNSTSVLSLLAPGAFWDIATVGGRNDSFSGTSAASPAAAGVFVLLREARPSLSSEALAAILRMSGRPVGDRRNNTVTPRVDSISAVDFGTSSFASSGGPAVAIPDGTGSGRATVNVSGFTGTLGSVLAFVQIDHPDPRQLTVSLTGPAGTRVVLQDRTGRPERPINTVFGGTEAPANPLTAFQGRQANGTWTLTVEDKVPTVTGRIRSFALNLLRGQPRESIPFFTEGAVLPVVGRVDAGRRQSSDVRVYNPGPAAKIFRLYYVAGLLTGAQAVRATRTVPPGQVLSLNDVVFTEYGFPESVGHLKILSSDTRFLATSRSSGRARRGTLGFLVPGVPTMSAIGLGGEKLTANGLLRDYRVHTDLGFTEVANSPVSVLIEIKGDDGSPLGLMTQIGGPNQTMMIPDIIKHLGLGSTPNFRADFTVTSVGGRVVPFATRRDDVTGDGLFEAAIRSALSSDDIIVADAVHARGANNEPLKTDLHISNLGADPAMVTVSLIPRALTGMPLPPRVYTIAPGETLEKREVLRSEFGLLQPSSAALRIRPSGPARLAVSARTFVETSEGTFGHFAAGVPASEAIGMGGGTLTAIHLDHTSAPTGQKSSFGFAEVAGAPVTVRVTAKSGDSGAALASKAYPLEANSSFQVGVQDLLGAGVTAANFYLQFTAESGEGRVIAYGLSADSESGDAFAIPAQKEP